MDSLSKMNSVGRRINQVKAGVVALLLCVMSALCHGQRGPGGAGENSGSTSSSESSSGNGSSYSTSFTLPSAPTGQNPFTSSVPEGKATGVVLPV
jgi:hypothetical protein